jgi:hypothetical protein
MQLSNLGEYLCWVNSWRERIPGEKGVVINILMIPAKGPHSFPPLQIALGIKFGGPSGCRARAWVRDCTGFLLLL